jgi:hypothetical protein
LRYSWDELVASVAQTQISSPSISWNHEQDHQH